MTQNRTPQQQQQTAADLTKITGKSTTEILQQLFNIAYEVKNVRQQDEPTLNRLLVLDVKAARLSSDVEKDKGLINTSMGIQQNISLLQQNRATAELAPAYVNTNTPLQNDVRLRDEQRKTLKDLFREHKRELKETTLQLVGIINGTAQGTKSELENKLAELERKQTDLVSQARKLNINENDLQEKLDKLSKSVFNAIPLSLRTAPGVSPPKEKPSEIIKPE